MMTKFITLPNEPEICIPYEFFFIGLPIISAYPCLILFLIIFAFIFICSYMHVCICRMNGLIPNLLFNINNPEKFQSLFSSHKEIPSDSLKAVALGNKNLW